ncbi:hypothetical protein MRX96_028661 [Rhipicephalus microplus]
MGAFGRIGVAESRDFSWIRKKEREGERREREFALRGEHLSHATHPATSHASRARNALHDRTDRQFGESARSVHQKLVFVDGWKSGEEGRGG